MGSSRARKETLFKEQQILGAPLLQGHPPNLCPHLSNSLTYSAPDLKSNSLVERHEELGEGTRLDLIAGDYSRKKQSLRIHNPPVFDLVDTIDKKTLFTYDPARTGSIWLLLRPVFHQGPELYLNVVLLTLILCAPFLRTRHWLDCGAQPTETVHSLLRQIGILPMVDFNKKEEPYYGSRKKKDGDKKKRSSKASAVLGAPPAPRSAPAPVVEAPIVGSFGSSFRGTVVVAKPSFGLQSARGLCAIGSASRIATQGAATSPMRSMSMVGMRSALQRVACACGV